MLPLDMLLEFLLMPLLKVLPWSPLFMRIWSLSLRDTIGKSLMLRMILFSAIYVSIELDPLCRHALQHSRGNDLSVWLSVMPIERDNFDLTAQEFCDALAIRYKKPLLSIPLHCDGCGTPSSLDHFLICKEGGLIV